MRSQRHFPPEKKCGREDNRTFTFQSMALGTNDD